MSGDVCDRRSVGARCVSDGRLDVSNTGFISVSDLRVVMGDEYPEEVIRKMMSVRLRRTQPSSPLTSVSVSLPDAVHHQVLSVD